MVSNFKFYSGKNINLRKSVSFSVVVGIAMGLVFLIAFSSTLPEMLFLLFSGYALSGYVIWAIAREPQKARKRPPVLTHEVAAPCCACLEKSLYSSP